MGKVGGENREGEFDHKGQVRGTRFEVQGEKCAGGSVLFLRHRPQSSSLV
jgi:hypothetical protein